MSVTTKKKHVERELYEDYSLPEEHQSIVKVVRPRGNNLHQVSVYVPILHIFVSICIETLLIIVRMW